MFSSRLKWNTSPNPLATLLAEKRRAGVTVFDLTESNPTHANLHYPCDEILAALADPRSLRYDPDPRGLLSAREAVSQYYAERGADVPASRILLTSSTSEAYSYLFKLLANPGDEILVPRPSYPLFEYLAALESVRIRQYPLRYDGGWHLDFAGLERAIGGRTRAIVIVNPNNPTGSFLKREEWERLERLEVPVLSDEVFADFGLAADSQQIRTLAGYHWGNDGGNNAGNNAGVHTGNDRVLTFVMSGLSKIAGLPQMKLGWIVAGGPGHEAALAGLEWIADTFLSVSTPMQFALPRLLAASGPVQTQILGRTRANLARLREAIGTASPCQVLGVEGGWYAVLQVPRTRSEEDWTLHLLTDKNVLVQPGFFYDFESEAFLVLSLLTAPEILEEGLRRILATLDESIWV